MTERTAGRVGTVVSRATWLGIVAIFVSGSPPVALQWTLLGLGMVLTGLPHGARDDRMFGGPTIRKRMSFQLRYVIGAASVIAFWWIAPVPALLLFLAISAWHFGRTVGFADLGETRTRGWGAGARGLAILSAPCLGHPDLCASLFTALCLDRTVVTPKAVLIVASTAALVASVVAITAVSQRRLTVRQLVRDPIVPQLVWLFVAPPVLGFGVWFAVWHSWPEVLHDAAGDLVTFYREAFANTAISLVGAGAAIAILVSSSVSVTDAAARVTFMGLAALTVPHMWVHARFATAGWLAEERVTC